MRIRDRVLSVILGFLLVAAIAAIVYVTHSPPTEDKFTEFYILGVDGRAENYPSKLALGEAGKVLLAIGNHEWEEITYWVEIRIDGEVSDRVGPIVLAHKEEWIEPVSLLPDKTGENQKVEFLLLKQGEDIPYISLYLWLDVSGSR